MSWWVGDKNVDLPLARNVLLWMLLAQSITLFPLLVGLPGWLSFLWVAVAAWKSLVLKGVLRMPSAPVRIALVVASLVGLYLSFGRFLGVEPMVSLLICAVLLKQLELRRRRDAIGLIYLSFFLVACQFLFNQNIIAGLYGLFSFWSITGALVAVHRNPSRGGPAPTVDARRGAVMLLQSVPLMVVMFVVLPRVGALWAVPSPAGQGVTGISDSMSPGDILDLSRSGGTAFRVSFEGAQPPRQALYWRAIVMPFFDGRRWQQNAGGIPLPSGAIIWDPNGLPDWRAQAQYSDARYRYRITLPATHSRWLFSLGLPVEWDTRSAKIGLADDWRLIAAAPLRQKMDYSVSAAADYLMQPGSLSDRERNRFLQLPESFNPETLSTAQRWRNDAANEVAFVQKVLEHYRRSFSYSLSPPPLGRDSVDDFLWRTQEGFCEHFASSFVVMMRAAGIPARVVTGYQGGEFNRDGGYWVVHQYDAHAWAEIWRQDQGWIRVDPTAVVAPERVQSSLGEMNAEEVEGLMSLGRYRNVAFIAYVRLKWDQIQYRWDSTILGFDRAQQYQLLSRLLGEVSPLRIFWALCLLGGLLLAVLTAWLRWQYRGMPISEEALWANRIEAELKSRSSARRQGEPMGAYLKRVSGEMPEFQPALERVEEAFNRAFYQPGGVQGAIEMQAAVRNLRSDLRSSGHCA